MSQQKRQLKIEFPANLSAVYANGAMVSQSAAEIVMDFIQVLPNDPNARIQTRVVMTPSGAKAFYRALGQNLERYEKQHGEISVPPAPASLADQLFGGIRPDDDQPNAEENHDD